MSTLNDETKPPRRTLIQAQARRHYEHVCRLHGMVRDLEAEIGRLRDQNDGTAVVGIPALVRQGRARWFALGEDGTRFKLVRDPLPALATPQEETR